MNRPLMASTQYGDFRGEASMTRHELHGEGNSIKWLREALRVPDDEKVVAVKFGWNQGINAAFHDERLAHPVIHLKLYATDDLERSPLLAKEYATDLTPTDFVRFFKEFDCVLTPNGFDGKSIEFEVR